MRKVIANEFMSLDGVIQSSGSDDDPTGGFRHGGWHLPYFDEISLRWVGEGYQAAGGFLFGRRTYELLAGHWLNARDDQQAIARPLNERPKYVATTTLSEPLDWENAHVLQGNVPEAVRALKTDGGGDLNLVGQQPADADPRRARPRGRLPADDHPARPRRRQALPARPRSREAAATRRQPADDDRSNSRHVRDGGELSDARRTARAESTIVNLMVQYPTTVDRAFAALADPTRRAVLERLGSSSATISELAEPFGMSLTGMKKHIRLLEEAELVTTEKIGRVRRCMLAPYAFEGISTWLQRLDRFAQVVERTKGDR
jgi:DNA-binding transcriptional ArsR family regulator/dihydrofolate reductase